MVDVSVRPDELGTKVTLEGLFGLAGRMAGMVEEQLSLVGACLERDDPISAQAVIDGDLHIDKMERKLFADSVSVLALRQPLGRELRQVVSFIKIGAELERIGDLAKNNAKRLLGIGENISQLPQAAFVQLHRGVGRQLDVVSNMIVVQDSDTLLAILREDKELDELYNSIFRDLMNQIAQDKDFVDVGVQGLFMAKNLERMGDHVTNVSEALHYGVSGVLFDGGRPKGDITPFLATAEDIKS
ncbi:MAG: phosphate signaling complex protein PhoU [Alphaproteobacteria bacterium]